MAPSSGKNEPIVFVNGEFVPASEAKISVFDHVVLYGDGVYDTMCAWNHMVFKLDEHVDRLYESAHAIKLEIPLTKEELKQVVLETVRRNKLRNAYVKVLATRGVGPQPLMSPYGCTPGLIVFAVPYMSLVAEQENTGIRMIVSSMRRVPNECLSSKIKSCNYLNHILMRLEANEAGADDAIELDMEGYVCEAPGYNVFMVKRGILYTPRDNILAGDGARRDGRPSSGRGSDSALRPVQRRRGFPVEYCGRGFSGGPAGWTQDRGRETGPGDPEAARRLSGTVGTWRFKHAGLMSQAHLWTIDHAPRGHH
jgi:branched-chain amino acid aminotransferase